MAVSTGLAAVAGVAPSAEEAIGPPDRLRTSSELRVGEPAVGRLGEVSFVGVAIVPLIPARTISFCRFNASGSTEIPFALPAAGLEVKLSLILGDGSDCSLEPRWSLMCGGAGPGTACFAFVMSSLKYCCDMSAQLLRRDTQAANLELVGVLYDLALILIERAGILPDEADLFLE